MIKRPLPGQVRGPVRRWLPGLLLGLLLPLLAGVALAWRQVLPPVATPPAASFPAALIAQGERLAGAGNCAGCHTVKGGAALAGGLGLETGFGLVYSTNISPDPETGIGAWSQQAFTRALHEGVSRDGRHLLPAFPYTHFTRASAADVEALYAFLMTRAPVHQANRANTLPFPLNVRALQAGWKLLYFEPGRYVPVAGRSEQWNRGAYLSEGLAHCASCHTPRNGLGAERRDAAYAGAPIDGWLAPALSAAGTSAMPWTESALYAYLRTGASAWHGLATGPMAEVVHQGLARLPDADIRAIAAYFADLNGSALRETAVQATLAQAMARDRLDVGRETEPGAQLYLAACASCHYVRADLPLALRPPLALRSAVTAVDPVNFIHAVLEGVPSAADRPGSFMPSFAAGFSDADIAQLAAYVRRTRSDQPAWPDLEQQVARLRQRLPSAAATGASAP